MIHCKFFFFLTGNKGKKEILQHVYRGPCEGGHRNQHEKRGFAEALATDVHRAREGCSHRNSQQKLLHEALPTADN